VKPRVLFIADAGPVAGGGHVMRSLTLARALAQRGAKPVFLASPAVASLLETFAPDMPRHAVAGPISPTGLGWSAPAADAIVFDHYGLARDEHQLIAEGRPTLVIDDLANRPLAADMILDPGPAHRDVDYASLAEGAQLMLGPSYALVRPEFAALRDAALARRGGPVVRVLVSLGLMDLGGVTARVVERLRRRGGETILDIVVGSSAPSLPALTRIARRDPRLVLHVDTQDMARLTAQANIGIGAAGSTTWERCVLGLPSALMVLAANQRPTAAALAAQGAALVIDLDTQDPDAALDRAAVHLLTDSALRHRLSAASAALCDGQGADRVAAALLQRISQAESK